MNTIYIPQVSVKRYKKATKCIVAYNALHFMRLLWRGVNSMSGLDDICHINLCLATLTMEHDICYYIDRDMKG